MVLALGSVLMLAAAWQLQRMIIG